MKGSLLELTRNMEAATAVKLKTLKKEFLELLQKVARKNGYVFEMRGLHVEMN